MTNKDIIKSDQLLTDETIIAELGEKIHQVRLRKNLTQTELAAESGVAKRTIERFEKGASIQLTSLVRILRALGKIDLLIHLIPEQVNSPMAQLLGEKKTRYRASKKTTKKDTPKTPWEWDD